MTVPTKNQSAELWSTASRVIPTPTISATVPKSITRRGAALRSSSTVTAPPPASANSARPPSSSELEPTTLRTTAGMTEP